jgi:transcriptional regulator with XRE-family HTH domain
MNIGQVIRALRKKRDETLEQLAFAIGTDPSNLSRIERGVQQPSAESLRLISASLETTVATLYASAEGVTTLSKETPDLLGADEVDYTEEAIQLRRQFRKLTPENQKIALELLRALNRTQGGK